MGSAVKQMQEFFYREAELGLLACNVELEQAGYLSANAACLLVNLGQKALAVHSMDKADVWGNVLHLVGLQMPDEVPFNVLRKKGSLALKLLHMAFSKDALSCLIGFHDGFGGVIFGNSHQPRLRRQL